MDDEIEAPETEDDEAGTVPVLAVGTVVTAEAGGVRGGGTALTPLGAEVVRRYRNIEKTAATAAAADIRAFRKLLNP